MIIFRSRLAVALRGMADSLERKEFGQRLQELEVFDDIHNVEVIYRRRDVLVEIAERADRVMEEKRLYLLSDLTLKKLAREVGSNRTYMSRAIHLVRGMGFRQYVNLFRLKHARELCSGGSPSSLEVALKSGFADIRTFNKATAENYRQMGEELEDL